MPGKLPKSTAGLWDASPEDRRVIIEEVAEIVICALVSIPPSLEASESAGDEMASRIEVITDSSQCKAATEVDSRDVPARKVETIPWIDFLGGMCYQVSGQSTSVTEREHCVFQAFLTAPGHRHSSQSLKEATGIERTDWMKVLRDLSGAPDHAPKYEGLFARSISRPGRKGRGGYHIAVRCFSKERE
jgi:hypothetical protein